jgi:hypothetical protein
MNFLLPNLACFRQLLIRCSSSSALCVISLALPRLSAKVGDTASRVMRASKGKRHHVGSSRRDTYQERPIHAAFIKYPEGDGSPNLDYEWITPDQSVHIAKLS